MKDKAKHTPQQEPHRQESPDAFEAPKHNPVAAPSARYEESAWKPSSFVSSSASSQLAGERPEQSEKAAAAVPAAPRHDDDYAEYYYANSATQSFLHDSYYPHLYYQDWHETQYDEADRAQDQYRDAAYDAQDYYAQEAYRDQEQYRQQDYYRTYDYGHGAAPFAFGGGPGNSFASSSLAAAGIMAAGEAYARHVAPDDSGSDRLSWQSYLDSAKAPVEQTPEATMPYARQDLDTTASYAYQAPEAAPPYVHQILEGTPVNVYQTPKTAYSMAASYDYGAPSTLLEDSSRLTVNREENVPFATYPHEADRLTINREQSAGLTSAQPVSEPPPLAYTHEELASALAAQSHAYDALQSGSEARAYASVPEARIGESTAGMTLPFIQAEPSAMVAAPSVPIERLAFENVRKEYLTADSPFVQPSLTEQFQSAAYAPEELAAALTAQSTAYAALQPKAETRAYADFVEPKADIQEQVAAAASSLHADGLAYGKAMVDAPAVNGVLLPDHRESTVDAFANQPVSSPTESAVAQDWQQLVAEQNLPFNASAIPAVADQQAQAFAQVTALEENVQAVLAGSYISNRAPGENGHPAFATPVAEQGAVPIASANRRGDSVLDEGSSAANGQLVSPVPAEISLESTPLETVGRIAWNEQDLGSGTVYETSLGASQLLIYDNGPDVLEGRYGWAIADKNDKSLNGLVKGTCDSLEEAQASIMLQAQSRGMLAQPEHEDLVHAVKDARDATPAWGAMGESETVPVAEQLLVDPATPQDLANPFLSTEQADVRVESHAMLGAILPEKQSESLLINATVKTDSEIGDPLAGEDSPCKGIGGLSAKEHAAIAGMSALGVASIAGGAAVRAGKAAGRAAMNLASVAAQEDEDLKKADDAYRLAAGAIQQEIPKHRARKRKDQFIESYLLADTQMKTAASKLKEAGVREIGSAANAEKLARYLDDESILPEGPQGLEKDALELSQSKEETQEKLLEGKRRKKDEQDGKDGKADKGKKDKKPATSRERELAEKKKALTDAKLDKTGASVMLSPLQAAKRAVLFGAGATTHLAASSAQKALAKENEDIATMLTMTRQAKSAVNTARKVARTPQRVAQAARTAFAAAKHAVSAVVHGIASLASLGWPALLMLGFILLVTVVAVAGSLVIINKNQELSETAALVAKLDEDLEAKIHSYGHRGDDGRIIPIYYCDARGTYNTFDANGHDLTKDVDMKDDASDLEEVDASSVEVFTNPDGIIAYIDAKYGGEWQTGAASWKLTVDWNGKSYNIFDWERVPEFVQKGLNEVDQMRFEGELADMIGGYLVHEFYGGYDSMTPEQGEEARRMAETIAEELGNVIYDQQIQGVTDDVVYEAIRAGVKQHRSDMELSDDQLTTLNYEIMAVVTELVGEQEPIALVYDEIVELHKLLNYWSEDHEHIDVTQTAGGGVGGGGGSGASNTNNAYGYPNSSGYDPDELAKWDGYNEVSVYGIGEPASVTADGTRITNDWSDTNMAIACEGQQNALFAYWTSAYKRLHEDSSQPVRITMYNPATGATVTAEVRDCGGWRGYNPNFAGMNATRQWDLLPAVWLALGGTQSSGLMNVYWKVDNEAAVTGAVPGAAAAEVVIGEYPWEKETDNIDGNITVNRATYIRHDIQDLMHNIPRLEKLVGRDNFASDDEFYAVVEFVTTKLKDIMKPVLTAENANGQTYTDYFMTRRELGNPFGKAGDGSSAQWVVTERFNPGFQDSFDKSKVSVGIKPLTGDFSVYAVKKGTVSEVTGNSVTVKVTPDTNSIEYFVYEGLSGIQVQVGDEVKSGTKLGTLADRGGSLKLSWYESFVDRYDLEWQRAWAYCPTLFMDGFAGYAEPEAPVTYVGGSSEARPLEDCETIVDFAYSRLGCPYVWGDTGPNTFDCSGLTQWCYAKAGITIPRTSEEQHDAAAAAGNCHPIDESQMQPGDILWKTGHVGIYIGSNQYIHAPQPGDVVKISTGINYFTHYLRFS